MNIERKKRSSVLLSKRQIIAAILVSGTYSFSHAALGDTGKRSGDNRSHDNPPPRGLNDIKRGTELIGAGVSMLTLSVLFGLFIREKNRGCQGKCDDGGGVSILIVGGVIAGGITLGLGANAQDEGQFKEKKYRQWEQTKAPTPSLYLNYAVINF